MFSILFCFEVCLFAFKTNHIPLPDYLCHYIDNVHTVCERWPDVGEYPSVDLEGEEAEGVESVTALYRHL